MAIEGPLRELGIHDVFQLLDLSRKTGSLRVTSALRDNEGVVYFESGLSWLERVFKADLAQRPPTEARKSFQAFQTLVQQFPKSPYATDASQRMV